MVLTEAEIPYPQIFHPEIIKDPPRYQTSTSTSTSISISIPYETTTKATKVPEVLSVRLQSGNQTEKTRSHRVQLLRSHLEGLRFR